MTSSETGPAYLLARATNNCGSIERRLGIVVTGNFFMTVSIESTSEKQSFDEVAEWDLEVYNQGQQLQARKMKIGGKHTTPNTSAWKEGVYIIRANYNGEMLSEKLVVKEQ